MPGKGHAAEFRGQRPQDGPLTVVVDDPDDAGKLAGPRRAVPELGIS
jgi:hypothetical protein